MNLFTKIMVSAIVAVMAALFVGTILSFLCWCDLYFNPSVTIIERLTGFGIFIYMMLLIEVEDPFDKDEFI